MSPNDRFPGFDHVYQLRDPLFKRAFRGGWEKGDAFALLKGEVRHDAPIVVPYHMGGATIHDFIWTSTGLAVVVSRRVVDLFTKHGITGWSTYPIRVLAKGGAVIEGFEGLSITGRVGPVDFHRSELFRRQFPARWEPHVRGMYFDEATWDGSDLFMSRPSESGKESAYKFATERVVDVLRGASVANVEFQRLTEVVNNLEMLMRADRSSLPVDVEARAENAPFEMPTEAQVRLKQTIARERGL